MKKVLLKRILIAFILIFSLVSGLFTPCFAVTPENSREAAKRISAGLYHSLALNADGTVAAWGYNVNGECDVPVGLTGVIAVSAGGHHSLALKADRTVVAWGENSEGECNIPAGLTGVIAVSAGGHHSLALKEDGTVVAWGDNAIGQCDIPAGLTGVMAISAGWTHSLALKADGTVAAWGYNGNGECGVPVGLTEVIAVSAGLNHSLALKANGTVVAWGLNNNGQCTVPAGLTGVIAVSAGGGHSLALKADGTVVAWGLNNEGQCTVPAGLTGVIAFSSGVLHSFALTEDGAVVAWGDNAAGQCNVPAGLNLSWGRLSGLSVSHGTLYPAFNPDNRNYTVIVDHNCTSVDVTPFLAGSYPAEIKVQGYPAASGVPETIPVLQATTVVDVSVMTEDGLKFSYCLFVIKRADATLSSLSISPGTLAPAFDPQVTSYSADIDYYDTSVSVHVTPADPMAAVTVNGMTPTGGLVQVPVNPGSNFIMVEVTAADSLIKIYTITVNRPLTPPDITITGTSPLDGAKGTNAKIPIEINFDETITAGLNFDMISVAEENRLISCTLSVSGNRLTITPQYGHLDYYRKHTVRIPAMAVKGPNDAAFASPYSFSFTTGGWWDTIVPKYLLPNVSLDNRKVTLCFNKDLLNNAGSEAALKAAISFAPNKTDFGALGTSDTVKLSGHTLVITFEHPISGKNNVIKILGYTLRDGAGNIIKSDINTDTIRAW